MENIKQIETEIWVKHPEKPGYYRLERKKTIKEVLDELIPILKEQDVFNNLEYFGMMRGHDISEPSREFPDFRWLSCYVVEGNSEGHYIHIDVITSSNRETIYVGKTLSGMEHALKVSNICTQAFYR